eukprot:CAMPEP_0170549976 /NCGR_PEP_ID=MMETSP0211-20121228/8046_1 /TAXON_ID=311385 /ORGANISM="Pseudokeronopsis sp., Strain OXSARD2" /LENGTH=172 /DNA_ID=CAMNT_0010856237 /DNA_START=421 /DNA_END=936 /DNA_ORIENTATION=-
MIDDALGEGRQGPCVGVVAPFQDTHQPPLAVFVGKLDQVLCDPLVLEFSDFGVPEVMEVVLFMGVEARGDKNEVWLEEFESGDDGLSVDFPPGGAFELFGLDGDVQDASWVDLIRLQGVFLSFAGAWVEGALPLPVQDVGGAVKHVLGVLLGEPGPVLVEVGLHMPKLHVAP